MKYTKYNYQKKNNFTKFLTSLLMTTLSAISIGVLAAWLLLKVFPDIDAYKDLNDNSNMEENNEAISEGEELEKFTLIQCGYFSKEENANQILNRIDSEFNSFIMEDAEGKYKVLVGVTNGENITGIMDKLKEEGIENIKVNISMDKNDDIENQIAAITTGYLNILDTVKQEDVKEVKTNEFKDWTNNLEDITEGDKNEVLKEYKAHINALPETINKDNVLTELEYIYSLLIKVAN